MSDRLCVECNSPVQRVSKLRWCKACREARPNDYIDAQRQRAGLPAHVRKPKTPCLECGAATKSVYAWCKPCQRSKAAAFRQRRRTIDALICAEHRHEAAVEARWKADCAPTPEAELEAAAAAAQAQAAAALREVRRAAEEQRIAAYTESTMAGPEKALPVA